ncbi:cytochrome P450 [Rhizoctonia solani]|nr:cytochrome P450 [Rhizoctonia solani]
MSRRYLERMSGRISAGASNLIKLWAVKTNIVDSCAFDAGSDIQLSTMDIMGAITTGSSFGCIESALAALPTGRIQWAPIVHLPSPIPPLLYGAVSAMMESVEAAIKAPFPSLHARLIKYTSPSWRKQFGIFSSFLEHAISESRKQEAMTEERDVRLATDADCVLDMIVQCEAREGAEAFGEGAIHDELMSFILAGQDTTSSMLQWLFKYLPTDAEIQHRLHNKVCSVFGQAVDLHEPMDFNLLDDPERLPLLEAVVTETMRCAGVGPQISRELIQDENILGKLIPKVVFATALMSRDKSRWGEDADEWRPTRWLTHDGAFDRAAGPSFSFGIGQRACFGQRLAVLEVKAYTAAISRSFFFKPVPQEVASWEVKIECLTKQPKLCYISLERWA